jgi:hypothetical protein
MLFVESPAHCRPRRFPGSDPAPSAHMASMTITATDARGATIHIGDIVTYVTGGRYPEIMTAEVVDIKVKVKLGNRDFLNRNGSWRRTLGRPEGGTSWVDGYRAIVVDALPFVEGRQNTAAPANA